MLGPCIGGNPGAINRLRRFDFLSNPSIRISKQIAWIPLPQIFAFDAHSWHISVRYHDILQGLLCDVECSFHTPLKKAREDAKKRESAECRD
jgi:hypothetical protein